jgi:hypothetical protein
MTNLSKTDATHRVALSLQRRRIRTHCERSTATVDARRLRTHARRRADARRFAWRAAADGADAKRRDVRRALQARVARVVGGARTALGRRLARFGADRVLARQHRIALAGVAAARFRAVHALRSEHVDVVERNRVSRSTTHRGIAAAESAIEMRCRRIDDARERERHALQRPNTRCIQ